MRYAKITGMRKRLPQPPVQLDLPALVTSWELALTAANKSQTTITSYIRCARLFLKWCEDSGHVAEITRDLVQT